MVDVIIPGAWSLDGLAAALASLASQRYPAFRVTAARPPSDAGGSALPGIIAILEARGHPVRLFSLPARATAGGRRQILLGRTSAPYVLVVEDGTYLEPDLLGRLVAAIRATGCGVVGSAVIDLRFRMEHHPEEQAIEFWDGPVRREDVQAGTRAWLRRHLHRGANLEHLRERLPRTRDRLYRIADIQGCVLYERATLVATGGFAGPTDPELAAQMSLESAAQLRILGRAGGAGLFPSGAYRIQGGGHPMDLRPPVLDLGPPGRARRRRHAGSAPDARGVAGSRRTCGAARPDDRFGPPAFRPVDRRRGRPGARSAREPVAGGSARAGVHLVVQLIAAPALVRDTPGGVVDVLVELIAYVLDAVAKTIARIGHLVAERLVAVAPAPGRLGLVFHVANCRLGFLHVRYLRVGSPRLPVE